MSLRLACVVAAMVAAPLGIPAGVAQALDLETVWREVAQQNPTLHARRANVDAAESAVAPAGAWPSPMVMVGAVGVPTSGRFDQEPMTQKQIGVTQRVPIFGRTGLSRRAAEQDAHAVGAATEMVHFEVFAMAWQGYARAYYAGHRVRVAEEHQAVMTRLVSSARARYESGTGRLEDVLRAQAEQARTLADLSQFRAEERAARARLDAIRGIEPGTPLGSLGPPPDPEVPVSSAAWRVAVDDDHPRLRELGARAARYEMAARSERRAVWPDLEMRFVYGFREALPTRDLEDLWTATIGFALPIFSGQREYANARKNDALSRAAAFDLQAKTLDLRADVDAIHAEAQAADRTVRLLADTVVVTQRRALEASWSAYGVGTTDLWRALEAAHTLYREEVALTRAREQKAGALARFLALSGRGDVLGVTLPDIERREP